MQLYWRTTSPSYAPLATVPENRIYVSKDRADVFIRDFLTFSHGVVTSDDSASPGAGDRASQRGLSPRPHRVARRQTGGAGLPTAVCPGPMGGRSPATSLERSGNSDKAVAAGAEVLV